VADNHAFNVVSNELVVVPLLTSRHGLEEQAIGKRDDHVVDKKIVFDVILGIDCQAHGCTTQTQIDL
jgi:hypothetical protein